MPLHLVDLNLQQDAGQEVLNLRSVQRRSIADRRQALREGNCERRTDEDRRMESACLPAFVEKRISRPVIDREEQLTKLREMHDYYYGVRVTRARCQPAIKLLDIVFSIADVPSLPLPGCAETCTCQYQGVRDRRGGTRRAGAPDRRKAVRESELPRRSVLCRRKSDCGFIFFKPRD